METSDVSMMVREYVARLNPDQPFVSERDIAEKFLMNRSNSRKLLMQLEGEGLLECIPQRGYRRVDYSNTTNRTFFTIRIAIESEAARLAAERASREDTLRLMLILEEAEAILQHEKWDKFPALDGEFHRALVNASHDNMLRKLFSFIYIPSVVKPELVVPFAWDAHRAHQAIFDAVRARDAALAGRAVHAHIGQVCSENKVEIGS